MGSRTVHLHVRVAEAIPPDALRSNVVVVSLGIDGDEDPGQIGRGLRSLGTVVLPLTNTSPLTAYGGPDLYRIVQDGALLGTVADDGTIALPLLDPAEADDFLGSIDDVDALRVAATAPAREIRLRIQDGFPVRAEDTTTAEG